ncbi:MAG: hypothetical protein KDE27_00140 [Planctomycetes bacterium]|nr:hypothetical protein [Planctomycetota bacterium]
MRGRQRAIVVAGVIALVGGCVVASLMAGAGGWQQMAAWAEAANREYAARDWTRPVAWGEAVEGEAFEHYRRALELLPPDAAPRARCTPAVAELQHGARCGRARPAYDVRAGVDGNAVGDRAMSLVRFAMLEASELAGTGDPAAAVRVLLDAATFAADVLESPFRPEQGVGCELLRAVFDAAIRSELLAALDPAALTALDRGTEIVLARLTPASRHDDTALIYANTLLRDRERLLGRIPWKLVLRAWSSREGIVLAAFESYRTVAQAFATGMPEEPWPARRARLRQIEAGLYDRIELWAPTSFVGLEAARYDVRIRGAMLRVALAVRRGEDHAAILDPSTGRPLLATLVDPGGVVLGSEGSMVPIVVQIEPR